MFDAVECNHTLIWVISTPTMPYNTPLVRYAHLVFIVYSQIVATGEIIQYCMDVSRLGESAKCISWPRESSRDKCVLAVAP